MYEKSDVCFKPLQKKYFKEMLRWLQAPHVKEWWDRNVSWSMAQVQEKYASYVKGYKMVAGSKKAIYSYIIFFKNQPVGYIQLYDLREHDFPCNLVMLDSLPKKLAGIDIFLGEVKVVGKRLGSFVIQQFLQEVVAKKFEGCGVLVDERNDRACRAYKLAGFKDLPSIKIDGSLFLVVYF